VSSRLSGSGRRLPFALIGAALLIGVGAAVVLAEQSRREFEVVSRRYSFSVAGSNVPEIRVMQNDLVHVTFSTEDIPHSFTIEEAPYRIMKRAEPGKPVSFDFRADEPGRFRFFCSLTADENCKEMSGTLIVTAR
jgi:heme/copper-type cytochrome/quinol oxidase subunit 2